MILRPYTHDFSELTFGEVILFRKDAARHIGTYARYSAEDKRDAIAIRLGTAHPDDSNPERCAMLDNSSAEWHRAMCTARDNFYAAEQEILWRAAQVAP